MADKVSRFEIVFDGEAGDLLSVLGNVKGQVRSVAAEIEQTTSRVELFKGTQDRAEELSRTIGTLSVKAAEFRQKLQEIEGTGTKAPKELTDALKETEKQIAATTRAFDSQSERLARIGGQLKAAGVDTSKLASEEVRLADALKLASTAETNRQAQQALGLVTLKQITPEVNRLYAAYNTLSVSGTLSAKELTAAQVQLSTRVAELRSQVTGLAASARAGGGDLLSMFSRSILPALGLTGGVAGLVLALKSAAETAREFDQRLAEIGTVTNLSKEQLGGLGDEARKLATDLGLNVQDALRGIFELIRSGVPEDNAIAILRAAAIASKAAITDLGEGVKAANVLMSAFGVSARDVGPALDKIVKGGKDGGATLKEFAESGAPLLSVAKSAGIELDDLVATLTVMVKASGDASGSIEALTKIIKNVDTEATREKLRGLGIEGTALVDIFRQIGERHLGLEQVLQLGVASTKSAAGVSALTNNAKALPAELDRIANSSGTAAKEVSALFDSPRERSARFSAQLDAASEGVGRLVGSGSKLQNVATEILFAFNQIPERASKLAAALKDPNASISDLYRGFLATNSAAKVAKAALDDIATASTNTADKNDRLVKSVTDANTALRDFGPKLLADIQALQAAAARDITDANERANAQIAALDRAAAATKATAAATLAIQIKLAADRLAIIVKEEADVNAAIDKATAAREASARKAGEDERKIAADSANARITALALVLAHYQTHYNELVAQAQTYASKLQTIENERVEFNRGVEKTLFDIRLSALSVFDQYVAKVQEVEKLISDAREAGAKGDVANAKKYTDEAIQLALSLRTVTDENGVKVITELQAQTQAQELVKKAAAGYNDTLRQQGDAAKAGSAATKAGIDEVLPKLQDLQKRYDEAKKSVAEGLDVRVKLDEKSVADAFATIDQLTKDREVHIKVIEDRSGTTPDATPPPTGPTGQPLARGGFAGSSIPGNAAFAQAFASGGPAFSRPAWNKVPGIGNADTIPAALDAGSFVVKQSASRYYGDALMAKVTGFAGGGTVTKDEVRKFAEKTFGYDPFAQVGTGGFSPTFGYDPFAPQPTPQAAQPTPSQFGMNDRSTGVAPPTPSPDLIDAPGVDEKAGFKSGDSFQTDLLSTPFSIDTRPIPEALITATNVIAYAREMLNSVGQTNPLIGSLLPAILDGIRAVQRNPNDQTALKALLTSAETIGANPYLFEMWGKTTSVTGGDQLKPEWFLDWLRLRGLVDATGAAQGAAASASSASASADTGAGGASPLPVGDFARRFFTQAIPKAGDPRATDPRFKFFSPHSRFFPFAEGGGSPDTVPAMLTPGEWVIKRPRAQQLGAGIMHAINNMAVAPQMLAGMLEPPRRPRGYAFGGEVGGPTNFGTPERQSGTPQSGGGVTVVNHFHLDATDLLSEDQVRRKVIPLIDRVVKRAR